MALEGRGMGVMGLWGFRDWGSGIGALGVGKAKLFTHFNGVVSSW